MRRYIDADALKDDLIHNRSFYPAIVDSAIRNTPTADVVEVRHGEWTKEVTDMWHCSICLHPCLLNGGEDYVLSNYCPYCGAKMDGERREG